MGATIQDYLEKNELHTRSLFEDFIKITNLNPNIECTGVMINYFNSNYTKFMAQSKLEIAKGNIEYADQLIKTAKKEYDNLLEKLERSNELAELSKDANVINFKNGVIQTVSKNILRAAHDGIQEVFNTPSDCRASITATSIPTHYGIDIIDIIWEGRNQAEHYSHPPFRNNNLKNVFNELQRNDTKFQNYDNKEIKAYEVIELLGWFTYEKYEEDMLLFS